MDSVDPGFKVLPPLDKREVGRQRELRYLAALRTRETSLGEKACGKYSAKFA
jgi:hypothetical protein